MAQLGDYLLLMHDDAPGDERQQDWPAYLARLQAAGALQGGSAIGGGQCFRKAGVVPPVSAQLSGFVRVAAGSLAEVEALLAGNPVFEAGGTVEVRELPRDE